MTEDEFRTAMARDASIRAPGAWTGLPIDTPEGWMARKVTADAKRCQEAAYNFKMAQVPPPPSDGQHSAVYAELALCVAEITANILTEIARHRKAPVSTLPAAALTPYHEPRDPLRRYRPVP